MYTTNSMTSGTANSFFPESFRNYLNAQLLFGALLIYFTASRVSSFLRGRKVVGYIPGVRCAFEPFSVLSVMFPVTSWNIGINFAWARRHDWYRAHGAETISIIPYIWGNARVWTSNIEVARQVVAGGPQSTWFKPEEFSRALLFFGMNIGAAPGGEVWRRHRRIMGPAFNNKTFALVWNETLRVYRDMVACEGWAARDVVDIPAMHKYTYKTALLILSACGFGVSFSWDDPPHGEDGSMSVQEALRIVSDTNLLRITAPKWLFSLPFKKYQSIETAHRTLTEFMLTQVSTRKAEIRQELAMGEDAEGGRSDVFSRLVRANESTTEKLPLDDNELIGNVFVLLFAGHETSGHTLAIVLAFLGVYQGEQDIVYENIINAIGHDRDPTYEDYPALFKVLAAFYEGLRLIPTASVLIRETTDDAVLTLPGHKDDQPSQEHVLPKGAVVLVDLVGIQYNPRYFPDPNTYKPSRWYAQLAESSNEPDAFTAFGIGPRTCIGRKFATTEAVCLLALLLRDWRVEIVLENGESREQWRERVLTAQMILMLQVGDVPIRLIRRNKA